MKDKSITQLLILALKSTHYHSSLIGDVIYEIDEYGNPLPEHCKEYSWEKEEWLHCTKEKKIENIKNQLILFLENIPNVHKIINELEKEMDKPVNDWNNDLLNDLFKQMDDVNVYCKCDNEKLHIMNIKRFREFQRNNKI